ncbi:major facilitator superfamily domain-containing protein [Aspergillus karnatakaensis]|uniref:major facilitator superfamily domain-containing protein n=1 Tax=Aspergillus karnatakaensis TaxID=1810916 RepID=UPI003CCCF69A
MYGPSSGNTKSSLREKLQTAFGFRPGSDKPWGYRWRSSNWFITTTLLMAIFNDEMLFAFMAPLLPYILAQRIGLDPALAQRYTSIFLAEGALAAVVSSPFVGSLSDRVKSKKVLLLVMLVLALGSVLCLALTTSLVGLLVGRLFQSIVSNAMWIIGLATLAENLGSEHMGKISGAVSTVAAAGGCAGPAIAGLLFGLSGYWGAWSGAVFFLVVDIILRLLMVEKVKVQESTPASQDEPQPSDPLLGQRPVPQVPEVKGWRFYFCLMREPRFAAGIFCFFVHSILITGFASTIAPHARDAFQWGVFPVGLLFASIQAPGILLAPVVGWLKDRVGSRSPTAMGLFAMVPFLILAGLAGDSRIEWAPAGIAGKALYATCIALMGCLMCLLYGVGTMEATETVDKIEMSMPGIFGPNGGYSRAVSVTTISWMTGSLVAPIVAGFLVEGFGYLEYQCFLAIVCVVAGIVATVHLGSKASHIGSESD